jgi:hypothetical protein
MTKHDWIFAFQIATQVTLIGAISAAPLVHDHGLWLALRNLK